MIIDLMRRNAERLKGHRVFLFGSRATGSARPHSDFDIGVIGDAPLPLPVFFDIQDQLEALPTLYRIDWVDFNKAPERLKEQALKQIEVLYE